MPISSLRGFAGRYLTLFVPKQTVAMLLQQHTGDAATMVRRRLPPDGRASGEQTGAKAL